MKYSDAAFLQSLLDRENMFLKILGQTPKQAI